MSERDQTPPETYDAIVIGSGFGGAVTACRLAEAGLEVCILERGQRFDPGNDFPVYPEHASRDVPASPRLDGNVAAQPDVSRLAWRLGHGLWDLRDLGGVMVGQAAGFGGGSLIYANVHLRPPKHVFDDRWPPAVTRNLDAYYDLAARMLDVVPLPTEHHDLPKRVQLNRAADELETREPYLRPFSPPLAVNFGQDEKRPACDMKGNCAFGCKTQAKNSLDLNYLRWAEGAGARVITRAEAMWVEKTKEGSFTVEYRDHLSDLQKLETVRANHVFLCAGAVNTTELLLRCREAGKLPLDPHLPIGTRFFVNQDAVATVFDCDEMHELDRGPTITNSLLYDRTPGDEEDSARWRIGFETGKRKMRPRETIRCKKSGSQHVARARVATPPYLISGSYEEANAIGELTVSALEGNLQPGDVLETEGGQTFATVRTAPHKLRTWLLIQDGGLPNELEPTLGIFRSPLWLRRNAFREKPSLRDGENITGSTLDDGIEHAAASQRIGYAALPFDAMTDLLSGLTRGAAGPQFHEVSEVGLQVVRANESLNDGGNRNLDQAPWSLIPTQLRDALEELHQQALDNAGLAAEGLVDAFLDRAATTVGANLEVLLPALPKSLREEIEEVEKVGNLDMGYPMQLALRLAVQLLWGSQGGLARAIAKELTDRALPGRGQVAGAGLSLLTRVLDYRLGNGRTAILLTMGLDSLPGTLALDLPVEPAPGSVIYGRETEHRAIMLIKEAKSTPSITVAGQTGAFKPGEALYSAGRIIGVCQSQRPLLIDPRCSGVSSLALHEVLMEPLPTEQKLRFASCAPLRAKRPPKFDTPERGIQERILRDLASSWRGELRTEPLGTFLDRGVTVHPQGGCPMGNSAQDSVTDENGQVFGCEGLYVMDAAGFPGPVGANPSATVAALAEYKVVKFLESLSKTRAVAHLQAEREKARQEVNERGRKALDPLSAGAVASPGPSAEPAHRPIGLTFEEKMVGTIEGTPRRRIETSLYVRIDDLAGFLARHAQDSNVDVPVAEGSTLTIGDEEPMSLDPSTSSLRIMADRGLDELNREVRFITYKLASKDHRCLLRGEKTIRDDAGIDAWEDTTTLAFRVCHDGMPGHGVLRLSADAFFSHQLPSFRVDTDDPARQAWAMASFARFFLGHLVDVYLPAFDQLTELGVSAVRRGYV